MKKLVATIQTVSVYFERHNGISCYSVYEYENCIAGIVPDFNRAVVEACKYLKLINIID